MSPINNPFRPGAGHMPPYLAGRQSQKDEFLRLLDQRPIMKNIVLTGLRGVGKTVLMESLKPLARTKNWVWVGADLSEASSISEQNIATRICADLALVTSGIVVDQKIVLGIGIAGDAQLVDQTLTFDVLISVYNGTPGLSIDKLRAVIQFAWTAISNARPDVRGVVFGYDEAQNMTDMAENNEFPLSLLLDTFQALQRVGIPMMLVLTGLPTLFPNLVEARAYAERMFRVMFLQSLSSEESRDAITKPIDQAGCPISLGEETVDQIVDMSGGYPYFIQYICHEVYEAFIQRLDAGKNASVPRQEIEQKLDTDFFAGRWARATDRQRELLIVIADLPSCDDVFTVQEIAQLSKHLLSKPFSSSHINQMLTALSKQGLVFKNRHGKYSFAVPLLGRYIRRQESQVALTEPNVDSK